jgi:hypothetical protein
MGANGWRDDQEAAVACGAHAVLSAERRQLSRYCLSGHLLYVVGNTLTALPFDPDRLRVLGPPGDK